MVVCKLQCRAVASSLAGRRLPATRMQRMSRCANARVRRWRGRLAGHRAAASVGRCVSCAVLVQAPWKMPGNTHVSLSAKEVPQPHPFSAWGLLVTANALDMSLSTKSTVEPLISSSEVSSTITSCPSRANTLWRAAMCPLFSIAQTLRVTARPAPVVRCRGILSKMEGVLKARAAPALHGNPQLCALLRCISLFDTLQTLQRGGEPAQPTH